MRQYKIVFGILSLIVTVAVVSQLLPKTSEAGTLDVEDVGADPAAYVGEITVKGIMIATSKSDPTIFGIMDMGKLTCTKEDCDHFILPVQFGGEPPVVGDEVNVTGSFAEKNGVYVFSAQSVEILRNHSSVSS